MTTLPSLLLASSLTQALGGAKTEGLAAVQICGVEDSPRTPSLALLQSFLVSGHGDPTAALMRRAEFFAARPTLALPKELSETLEGTEPEPLQNCSNLTVSTGSIYFGDQRVNTSNTRYFTISNPNCCPVNYTISGGGYGFSLSTSGGTIPANGSVSVGVTFTPYNAQSYSGSVSISPGGTGVSFSGRGVD